MPPSAAVSTPPVPRFYGNKETLDRDTLQLKIKRFKLQAGNFVWLPFILEVKIYNKSSCLQGIK